MWGALSDERTGLSFTIAADPRQRSHWSESRVTHEQILLSHIRDPPKPGGPGHRICTPQEQGDPVMPLGTGFPFRRLLRLAGLRCTRTRLHADQSHESGMRKQRSKIQFVPDRKHSVFITTDRLMLFGETVAVYCENRMEHTNTLCGQNL
jgi:hypothetical protein